MKATEAKLLELPQEISTVRDPIYQRTYSWTQRRAAGKGALSKRTLSQGSVLP
jgi:hypothetical protein